uniref:Uncharacterized protein n=1 Tax=Peduovirinae sp. ctySy20 TaxID=2825211 RepID=A0A8S5PW65_9CAUD|nr:MAG TPA: hypothetical protein [Peduovirinae sp. ctySy20]
MECQRYGLAYRMIYPYSLAIPRYAFRAIQLLALPTIAYISNNKKDLRFLASP